MMHGPLNIKQQGMFKNQLNYKVPEESHATEELVGYDFHAA
jgi:hypothetical protein